jgi:hypothetical protein
MTPRIIIPHGLAADVLRVLDGTRRGTCGAIVDAIDELRGYADDDAHPGVGFSPVWSQLDAMNRAGILTCERKPLGTVWAVRRG